MGALGSEDALVKSRTLFIEPADPHARPNTEEATDNKETGDETNPDKNSPNHAVSTNIRCQYRILNGIRSAFASWAAALPVVAATRSS